MHSLILILATIASDPGFTVERGFVVTPRNASESATKATPESPCIKPLIVRFAKIARTIGVPNAPAVKVARDGARNPAENALTPTQERGVADETQLPHLTIPVHGASGSCACKVCECIVCECGEVRRDRDGVRIVQGLNPAIDRTKSSIPSDPVPPPAPPAEAVRIAQGPPTPPPAPQSPCECANGPTCSRCGGYAVPAKTQAFTPGVVIPPAPTVAAPSVARMADATGQVWTHPDGTVLASWIAQRNAQAAYRAPVQAYYAPAQGYTAGSVCGPGGCGTATQGYGQVQYQRRGLFGGFR